MIKIAQPAAAWNAEDAPGSTLTMWTTFEFSKYASPGYVCGTTATIAKGASGGKLKAVVVNCHGSHAYLDIGTGIGWGDIFNFKLLSGVVDDIYIVACEVVSFSGAGDGSLFCGEIAKAASANVFASNSKQFPWRKGIPVPYGWIDGYEGDVWKYHPDGTKELTWWL